MEKTYKNLKAPFIDKKTISHKAHTLREEFLWDEIPVDVMLFASKIWLSVFPRDLRQLDAEAFLVMQENTIYVDSRIYNANVEFRARFSVAHEIGHYLLHKKFYEENMSFTDEDDYLKFYQEFPEEQYSLLEMHANEFAWALLVPKTILWEQLLKNCETPFQDKEDLDVQVVSACEVMKNTFNVSSAVLLRRIRNEGFSDNLKKLITEF